MEFLTSSFKNTISTIKLNLTKPFTKRRLQVDRKLTNITGQLGSLYFELERLRDKVNALNFDKIYLEEKIEQIKQGLKRVGGRKRQPKPLNK